MIKWKIKNKYNAISTQIDGIKFHSKLEAAVFANLKLLQKAGEINLIIRQPKIDLAAGVSWKIDFLVINKDNSIEFIEAKGFETADYKIKAKLFKTYYPDFKLTIIKKAQRISAN